MPTSCATPILFPTSAAAPVYFQTDAPGVAIAPGFPGSTIPVGPPPGKPVGPQAPPPPSPPQAKSGIGGFLALAAVGLAAALSYKYNRDQLARGR